MTELTTLVTEPLDPKLHNRLTRFLHTGNEFPKYYPGSWAAHKYFEADKLIVIEEILNSTPNNLEVVNVILKAYKDGWYTRYETIAFALAKILHLTKNSSLKQAVYNATNEVCQTPEQFMSFNKFTRLLKSGQGQGWCKSVKNWYTSREPMELAKELTRVRSRYGRSHKTLLRKSHLKIDDNDHARDALVKYAIFGLKKAKQAKGEFESVKPILDYIQNVEDLRHCEDPVAAAAIITRNKFVLDHVPGHLLTSQEIWNAILPQLTLSELLYNIQRIHNMGYLTKESPTTDILLSLLKNSDYIRNSNVSTLEVYITLSNYMKKSRPMKHAKAKIVQEKETRRRPRQVLDQKSGIWSWSVTKRHPKEVKYWGIDLPPNPDIENELSLLIDKCWELSPPTGARYLITMDMRNHMFSGRHFCKSTAAIKKLKNANPVSAPSGDAPPVSVEKVSKKRVYAECFYNTNVTPGHIAIVIALQILKREKNVELAVFTDEGIELVVLDRSSVNIKEAEFIFRRANLGRVQLDAAIKYATEAKRKYDVFIDMVDRTTRYMELDVADRGGRGAGGRHGPLPRGDLPDRCPARALDRYRTDVNMPDSKLIVMSLASHRVETTDGSSEGLLDVVGVDEHVLKVMDAFVHGQFK